MRPAALDIDDVNGEAEVVKGESIEEYLSAGGSLIDRISGAEDEE